MKILAIGTCVAVLSTMIAAEASAMPLYAHAGATPSSALVHVKNGYGPLPYGLYGHKRRHRAVSNGTGYHGRGTRTGGPAGGLPGRS